MQSIQYRRTGTLHPLEGSDAFGEDSGVGVLRDIAPRHGQIFDPVLGLGEDGLREMIETIGFIGRYTSRDAAATPPAVMCITFVLCVVADAAVLISFARCSEADLVVELGQFFDVPFGPSRERFRLHTVRLGRFPQFLHRTYRFRYRLADSLVVRSRRPGHLDGLDVGIPRLVQYLDRAGTEGGIPFREYVVPRLGILEMSLLSDRQSSHPLVDQGSYPLHDIPDEFLSRIFEHLPFLVGLVSTFLDGYAQMFDPQDVIGPVPIEERAGIREGVVGGVVGGTTLGRERPQRLARRRRSSVGGRCDRPRLFHRRCFPFRQQRRMTFPPLPLRILRLRQGLVRRTGHAFDLIPRLLHASLQIRQRLKTVGIVRRPQTFQFRRMIGQSRPQKCEGRTQVLLGIQYDFDHFAHVGLVGVGGVAGRGCDSSVSLGAFVYFHRQFTNLGGERREHVRRFLHRSTRR
mmetsp:Transcript_49491/g.149143  ORF Transcript_49491/g.149143 Transcript_49491/m.149143 type:complete len:460 (+) Transcript_49491:572-1951(+)